MPLVEPIKVLLLKKQESIKDFKKLFRKGYHYGDSDYVCVNELGNLIKPRTLSDNFKRITGQNKIRKLRLYDCRHTAASLMLKNGINMKQIQLMLGHSDYATTANIYSHIDYTDKLSATETMTNIIFGES